MNKIIAIIPARGGSKGLPRKNVLDLNGKPLIAHTIEAALKSDIFSKIVVTTDDKEIREVALEYGAEVIDRPKELATDSASSLDVIEHTLHCLEEQYESFVLLQPTSPLRTSEHIREAFHQYKKDNAYSLVSIVQTEHPPFKMLIEEDEGKINPLFSWQDLTKPRQQLPTTYLTNGAIYICKSKLFLEKKNLFEPLCVFYKMDGRSSLDIDTKDDFELCEKYIKGRK